MRSRGAAPLQHLPKLLGTLGPVGYLPWAPGTWGSAAGIVIWWFALAFQRPMVQAFIILFVSLLAVWCSGYTARCLNKSDPKPVVIDEVVGQWTALMFVPRQVLWVAAAFLLFRMFDIVKPFPINRSQRLPGGWGIVIDDLLAGLAVMSLMLIFLRIWA